MNHKKEGVRAYIFNSLPLLSCFVKEQGEGVFLSTPCKRRIFAPLNRNKDGIS